MSLDNIAAIINSLVNEPQKLSDAEKASLFLYLTNKSTKLTNVEKFLNLCMTNNAKIIYLRGLLKKFASSVFL